MTGAVDPSRYGAFLVVATAMCFSPGPANLFSVAVGMSRGRAAMLMGMLGMNLASLVWYGAAALGLSALIVAFPGLFRIVTVLGAAYLLSLAARAFLAAWRGEAGALDARAPRIARSTFLDGFVVQISNPKAVIFLGAVLPPFIDRARPLGGQFALFAAGSTAIDMLAMTLYGLAGAALTARLTRPGFARGFHLITGAALSAVASLIILRG